MATFDVTFFSKSLCRHTSFKVIIPNDPQGPVDEDKPLKTIFLLHGYTGNAGNWIPDDLISKYNIAIVMPNGENAFYLDSVSTGHKFCTFVGEELVSYVRKTFGIAKNSEDTYIMGMSMGGFGSIHTALSYPDTFSKVGAMSSALIVHKIVNMKPGDDDGMANYYYYRECFGELDKVIESNNNPETLVKNLQNEGKKLPEMYLCCGTEDFLIENNREFHQFLVDNSVEHVYLESKGSHDMVFWDEYTKKILEWMFN